MADVVVRPQDYRFLHPILRLYTQEPSALEVGDEPHPTAVARLISEHHVVEDLFGTYRHDVSYTRIQRTALVITPQLPRMRFVLIGLVVLTALESQGASPGTRETDHGILVERQRLAAEDYHTQFHDEPIRKYVEDVMQEVRPCPPLFARPRSMVS